MINKCDIDGEVFLARDSIGKARAVLDDFFKNYCDDSESHPQMAMLNSLLKYVPLEKFDRSTANIVQWVDGFSGVMLRLNIILDYILEADKALTGVGENLNADISEVAS